MLDQASDTSPAVEESLPSIQEARSFVFFSLFLGLFCLGCHPLKRCFDSLLKESRALLIIAIGIVRRPDRIGYRDVLRCLNKVGIDARPSSRRGRFVLVVTSSFRCSTTFPLLLCNQNNRNLCSVCCTSCQAIVGFTDAFLFKLTLSLFVKNDENLPQA